MAYTAEKVKDIVTQSVNHAWSIPEFQRGFVWKAVQVRDLVESLWLDYPIGTLLVWDSGAQEAEEKHASDAQQPHLWVVDGQQRTTALSILFGRKPYWWPSAGEWEKTLKKYDIRFDVHTKEPPYFVVANAAIRKVKGHRYLPIAELLVLDTDKDDDQRKLTTFAKEIKEQGLCDGMDAMEVYTRLDRVRKIRDKDVVTISIDHELEDVVEIFSRLNGRGTRVTEADIYLGVVAARTPGWVRTYFLPYIEDLVDAGFDVSPNLVFRTLTAVGAKKVRFKEIPDSFWNESSISPHWDRTKQAWKSVVHFFQGFGILSKLARGINPRAQDVVVGSSRDKSAPKRPAQPSTTPGCALRTVDPLITEPTAIEESLLHGERWNTYEARCSGPPWPGVPPSDVMTAPPAL